ncbi:ABC-F type ribosomal protection protein [Lachnospiraceae bacterium OttesenSCG-928-E19]|nr:ABC-F type ribosomal protection protein [Lachnospiraceae bacterium OttesenSCG-928-E19]
MSQINVSNLSFYYDGSYEAIFDQVSFQIDTDWKLGLVGRNGRGKTTFLNLLMKKYEYTGSITSAVEFEYFPFAIENMEKTGIEILEEIDPLYEFWRVCREMNLLELEAEVLYRPFSTLSNGERTKIMLSVLFAKENAFLLIDEPTNHLDTQGRESVMQYLKKKKGFILVSHDRNFLDGCVDHILAINKTDIDIIQGNFTSWWNQKKMRDESEYAEDKKLRREIGKMTETAAQVGKWSEAGEKSKFDNRIAGLRPDRGYLGHKAAKVMKRSKIAEKRAMSAVEEKKKLLKNIESEERLKLFPMSHHKEVLVSAEGVGLSYGEEPVFENISFELRQGTCTALEGINGCGKSSMLKLILGQMPPSNGKLELASNLVISYVPQDTSFLKGSLDERIANCNVDERLFKALLRKLDFPRSHFEKKLEDYSDGQKKKVLLAGSLCQSAHLYIWDEPLNFIDVFSRIQLEDLIKEFRPTILLVEHDKRFLSEVGAASIQMLN